MAKSSRERNKNNLKLFGQRLYELRVQQNMSQEELADRAGVAFTTINRLENGGLNTGISTIFDLAKGLGVEPKKLLDF